MTTDDTTSGGPPDIPPELFRTLDTLEDLVDHATQWLGRALSIPCDDFAALTVRVREDMPRAISQSNALAARVDDTISGARRQAEAIVAEAHAESERILANAGKQAAGLVEASPEVQFATAQQRDIIAQAQQASLSTRQDADDYARETMRGLEEYVNRLQHQVRSGLTALARERAADTGPAR